MKKIILTASAAASLLLCASCAKVVTSGPNDANKRYFDSWIKIYHPDAQKDGLGVYIIEDKAGTGKAVGDADTYPYVYVSYTTTDLEGNISATTDASVAQQVGTYSAANYYGPQILMRTSTAMSAGLEMVVDPMKVGGTRKAVIPGWLNTTSQRFDSEKDYLDNVTGTDVIYTITVQDVISDIEKWQIDSIERYISHNFAEKVDSLKYGFYYIQTQEPTDTASFSSSATVYINYTGKRLDGAVFDTTLEKVAKDGGIYSDSKTYSTSKVTLADEYTDISMDINGSSSSLINGFSYCISQMKAGEKGICLFISSWGYGGTASGNSIPAYSPLRFEIEMLGTENN